MQCIYVCKITDLKKRQKLLFEINPTSNYELKDLYRNYHNDIKRWHDDKQRELC